MGAVMVCILQARAWTVPSGVNTAFAEGSIPGSWSLVYMAPYNDTTSTSDFSEITDGCVFFGAKGEASDTEFYIGAFAEASVVISTTSSITVAAYNNGAYWYNYPGLAIGFSPSSMIYLYSADRLSTDCGGRLSWHLDQASGGWRAGCNTHLNSNTIWYKYVYSGPCSVTEAPTALPSKHPTTLPTRPPTALPTGAPTESCEDEYHWCSLVPTNDACYADDNVTRTYIHNSCPLTCNTCGNNTLFPTPSPTIAPPCEDLLSFCDDLSCEDENEETREQTWESCPYSCGICTRTPTNVPSSNAQLAANSTFTDDLMFVFVGVIIALCCLASLLAIHICKKAQGQALKVADVELVDRSMSISLADISISHSGSNSSIRFELVEQVEGNTGVEGERHHEQ